MTADQPEYVVLGATGHVGSAVASTLLGGGHRVRVITRSAQKGSAWAARGAEVAVVDIADVAALQGVLSSAEQVRVLALNPPGPVDGDPDAAETSTADAIVAALLPAGPERVVALSTYGARAGSAIGDLGTLHHFEQRLAALDAPVAVVRAGYLYSNWDGAAAAARDHGRLSVMTDPDRPLPMVAPADVGAEAAGLLTLPTAFRGVVHVEGPTRPTPQDVADAFSAAGGRPVRIRRIEAARWRSEFESAGFSPLAAASFVGLNRIVEGETWRLDREPTRGTTTLQAYVNDLVRSDGGARGGTGENR